MNKIERCKNQSSNFFKIITLFLSLMLLGRSEVAAQYGASALYTDYKGYWTSAVGAINSVQPDNKHNLLGFKWNGVNYSTGVNDLLLATKISFTPGSYQAFPVKDIPLPGTASNFVGLGQLEDGVDNGGVYPYTVPVTVSQILTRGTRGLDMGSCITNIPSTAQPLSFNFGAIADDSQIGDGIPDIVITQVAQATGALDEVYFEDANGILVGNKISIDQSAISSMGNWLPDFYNPNTGVIQPGFIKTDRPIRIWAADASAFGITSFNYQKPLVLRYKLGGSSDPAFLAFNTKFITLVTANDDLAATTLGVPVVIDVLNNDIPNNQASLSSYTVPTSSAHGTIVKNANGTLTYTPAAGYYGQDTFTYSICTNINGTLTCDDAIVTVNIAPDVVAPVFTSGTNIRCQGTGANTYTASSAFATSMAFAVSPNTAGTVVTSAMTTSSNVGTATGTVTWASDFYGTATVTAIAYGSNGPKSSTYSVTVNQAPTLTASGNTKNVCAGTAISSTYTWGGGATDVSYTTLPAGLSASKSGSVLTISGIPTASGSYTVSTTGQTTPCNAVSVAGTVTINEAPTLVASGENQIVCAGTSISSTYTWGGSATDVSYTTLPAGLTASKNGKVLTVSGTPTTSGTYSVSTLGQSSTCSPASVSASVNINPSATLTTTGNVNQTVCETTAITPIEFAWGGSATDVSYTTLPTGLTAVNDVVAKKLIISGTPTASGTFTVSSVGQTTPCVPATSSATITVTKTLAPTASDQTFCENEHATVANLVAAGTAIKWYSASSGGTALASTNTLVNGSTYYATQTLNGCESAVRTAVKVTINSSPNGFNDAVTVACDGVVNYNIQTSNLNNTGKGGNSVPSTFTWTVNNNPEVAGASAGSGNSISQTLINKSNILQTIVYTVTPTSTTAGTCVGNAFTITATVPVCSSVSITKTTPTVTVSQAGDLIPYTIVVKNTGNSNQNNVVVTDALLGGVLSNPAKTGGNTDQILEKNEVWTYTGSYIVKQSDLNSNGNPTAASGQISNVASVNSAELPTAQTATANVNISILPGVTLVKTIDGAIPSVAGGVLKYNLVIKNTGNVTLSNLAVADANAVVTGSPVPSLAPGASVTLTAVHTLTQSDIDAGTYSNTATVTGKTPAGLDVTDVSGTTETNDTPTVATIPPAGAVTLVKSVNGSVPTAVGGVLNYDLIIKNTGNVTLANLVVTDANALVTGSPVSSLAPGASVTLTAAHTLTQVDVDAGTYTNTATVTGKTPAGADVTDVSGTTETNDTPTLATITPAGAVTLVKSVNGSVPMAVGGVLNYNLVIKNTGNVTLTNLIVTDANAIVTGSPVSTLAPGASVTLTAAHTLTQVDVDAGTYTNTASITGKTPAGADVTDVSGTTETNDTPTVATIPPAGAVTLVKSVSGTVPNKAGEVLNYNLVVKNIGNVTLTNLAVADANAVVTGSPVPSLAPGASVTLTASHTLTQSDVDAGTYSNTATVTGKTPAGLDVTDVSGTTETNDTPTVATITPAGSVTLVKTVNGTVPNKAGEVLNYNLVVKNTGNVTLSNLVVTDVNAIVTGSPVSTLAPGASITLTAAHTLTQVDVDAGTYTNTASITGKTPAGTDVTDVSGTTETNDTPTVATIPPAGAVTLVKSVNGTVPNKAGEELNYNLVVKNTGNVTLTNLVVTDANAIVTGSSVSSLAPGASVTLTAAHTLTQVDVDAGTYTNTASITGKTPAGADVTDVSGTTETNDTPTVATITPAGAVTLVKTVNGSVPNKAGEVLNYDLVVKNIGNVTLSNLVVIDANAIVTGSLVSSLAPGASVTLTAAHTLTQGDVDAGTYSNTATVTGKTPAGADVTDVSGTTETNDIPTVATITPGGAVTLVKSVNGSIPTAIGGVLNYNLVVKNTGNVTLTNLVVTDANAIVTGSPVASLTPGASVTLTASHTLIQSDVDAGTYTNTATVTGKTPAGADVTDVSGTTETNDTPTLATIIPVGGVTLVKTINGSVPNKAGEELNYNLVVRNTGNVTLTNLVVTDANAIVTGSPVSTLAPGASVTLTAVHTLTQVDVDAGIYTNTASITGKTPAGLDVTDVSGTTETNDTPTLATITPAGSVTLVKTINGSVPTVVGGVLNYDLIIKNTGNVTLINLVITDANAVLTGSPVSSLAPGASITLTASHTLTQSDIDAGTYSNTATVTGKTPAGADVNDISGTTETNDTPTLATITAAGSVTLVKTINGSVPTAVGGVLNYNLVIKNTGNVTLTNLVVTDANAVVTGSPVASLAPGGNVTLTAVHILTQADIDAGTYSNTATVTGKTPAGADVSDLSGTTETNDTPTVATIPPAGSVTLVKSVNGSVPNKAGEVLNYNLVVKNTGNVTLTNLAVSDANAVVTGSPVSSLAPGASVTLTAAHTLTQVDVDAGTYTNTASITGKTPAGADVTDVSGTTETNDTPTLATITPAGSVTLVKSVSGTVPNKAGDVLNYNLVVKNTGNVTLTNLVVTDANALVTGSPVSTLAPGASVTLTASHTLIQSDVDAGTYSNTATVTGKTPAGADVTDVSGTTETNDTPTVATIPPAGAVTLVKSVSGIVPNKAGEVLNYNLVVKNTGNVTLTYLVISDANAIVTGSPVSSLAPGASVTLTASHTLTQGDVDAGAYSNTATVTGKTPAGADVTDVSGTTETNDTPTVATIPPAGAVTLVKSVSGIVPNKAGEVLNYNLVVKNTGNVTLTYLVISDANAIVTGSPVSSLAPGASVTLTASHTLTQGDVDAGAYSNTATVTGKTPAGSDVTDVSGTTETNDTPTVATITPAGAVTLVKSVNGTVPNKAGEVLNYDLVVKNTGNVTLTNLVITDANAVVTGSPVASLAPGASVTLTASHTLTQGDVDAGAYSNTATVTGKTPAGSDVTDVSGTTETNDTPTLATITPSGAVTLVKSISGNVPNKAGEVLNYNLVVKNTGNVTLTNLVVTDVNALVTGSPVSSLAPGASVTLTAVHTLTQGDVDAGTYTNTASVTGKTPAGADVSDLSGTAETNDTPTVATITPAGAVTLVKTVNGTVPNKAGEVLNYDLVVKNTGNVTLTNLVITDANATVTGSPISSLAPGASVTLGAVHTLTQSDMDAGIYSNTAMVTGKTPAGLDVTDVSGTTETNDTPTVATITPAGTVTLVKTVNSSVPNKAGEVLNYDLVVKNTGNVTLTNLVVTDANALVTGSPVSTLAPGASVTLTASHTLTQADIDAGTYANTARVTGKTPAGLDVTDVSGTTETNDIPTVATITPDGAVTLVKTINGSVPTAVGGVLNYNLVIKNTGNVTLTNLVVTDANAIVTGSPVSTLAPGASVTLTAVHTLTQADIDAGTYSNTATVTGKTPAGSDVTDVSGTTETNDTPTVATITPAGTVTLVKTVNGSVPNKAGEVLNYNLVVKNTGNVTLTNLVFTDANAIVTGSPVSTLAPGASITLTAFHTLTQGDVDAGTYTNTASVTGKTPAGADVNDISGTTETNDTPTVATIIPGGSVTLVKTINGSVPTAAGGVLNYDLIIKNTGNVTLANLVVTDANAVVTGSPVSTLAPGASVTLTAAHTLIQSDVDAGTYTNTASVTGKTPAGADVTDVSGTTETNDTPTVATITPAESLTLVKTVNGTVPNKAGQVLNYDLVVKNTGNVTLTNLVVTDANATVTGSPISSLAPGASVTLTANHTLTQSDVDAGTYTNTATVTGKTPAGADVTDVSGTTETNDTPTVATITPAGAVTLVKTVNGTVPNKAGEVLNYNLVVKNIGNVTLSNLVVTDANAVVTGSPVASLAPGASVTLTASHTLTQGDVDAGAYSNTATVTGKTPAGSDVTDVSGTTETNDTPTVATITPAGAVTLVKTVNGTVPNKAGEVLNYDLVVKNTGNVTLTNLVLTDANAIVTGSPVSTLAPGASVTLTAAHTLTQVDVDAGTYSNTAMVTGKTPAGLDVTDVSGTTETNDTPTVSTITPAGSVTLVKTINGSIPTVVGGVLNYNLIIKNTGNVTLTNLVITDANAVVSGSPGASLAPGASVTLTAAHTLTQGDVDAGTYSNTATVTGKTPAGLDVIDVSGTTETNDTPTVATITPAGAVTLVKTVNGSVPNKAGEVLNYNLVIKNTGNITLTNLVVTDANAIVTGSPVSTLAPGASVTLTASHTLIQSDVDAGTYTNTASVTGKTPAGADVVDVSGTTETNDTPTVATITPAGAVTLVKSVNGSVPNKAGEVLNYNLVIKNNGNVTLTNLVVTDANAIVTGSPVSSLAPGASVTLTASHTLIQSDVDAGTYTNTASVTGKTPAGADVVDVSGTTETNDTPTVATITPAGAVTLVKSVNGSVPNKAGEVLNYNLVIKNNGNVTLTNLVVTDANAIVTGSPVSSLAPGASVTLSAVHTLTQADIDAGTYSNTATVTGKTPAGADVTDVSGTTETNDTPTVATITPAGAVTLVKTVNGTVSNKAGEVLNYNLVIKNTGNVTLTNLVITDANAIVTGSPVSTLAPGASVTLTAAHTLIQSDVDAGTYTNTASVTGKTPAGLDVTDVSGTTETNDTPTVATIPPAGAVTLVKNVNGSVPNKAGEELNYNLVIKNAGNVTLTNLVVTDANAVVTNSPVSTLAPGAIVTLTAAHTLTQVDVDAGTYTNTASITGKTPAGADVTDVSGTTETNDTPTVATITPAGAVTLVKSVNGSVPTAVGGVLNYDLIIKNTGNVTLANLVVTDANALVTGSPVSSLAPGASVTLTAAHTLTQVDVDAGTYTNTASITGKTPAGADVTDVSGTTETNDTPTVATITTAESVTLVKSVSRTVPNKAGDVLNYNLVVKNTGNVTLANLVVTDANALVTGSPVSSLAPGASVTLTAVHTLTQADIDAGTYSNTATVTGKTPAGSDVTDVSGTTETNDTPTVATITPAGAVTLVKTINGSVPTAVGGALNYNLVIKNTGNVTLTNLVVTDANAIVTGSPVSTLAPGASVTLTAVHALTQVDVDAGTYSNTATVTGKTPAGADVTDVSGTTETNDTPTVASITPAGAVTLVKTVNGTVSNKADEVLNYNLVVKNVGNVTLTNLVVTDANAIVTGSLVSSLAPGASVTLTAVHTLTQVDVDAGTYSNTAMVTGKTPAGADVTDISGTAETNDIPTVTTITPDGAVTLVKTINGSVPTAVGGALNYNLVIKNTGNVTLTNLAVSDANAVVTGSPVSSLAPGASVTLTAVHSLTQADMDAGTYSNTASVTGKTPVGADVTDVSGTTQTNDIPTVATLSLSPSYTFTKIATNTVNKAGDVINYRLILTNTGNVTLTDIQISDDKADAGSLNPADITAIAPGESASIIAKHIVTQSDVNSGGYINQAKASVKDSKGNIINKVSDDPSTAELNDPTVTKIVPDPSVRFTKMIANSAGVVKVIEYSILVTNTGNITLTDIVVTDPGADAGSIRPSLIAKLDPAETAIVSARHTLIQPEIDYGKFVNQATVTASFGTGANRLSKLSDDPTTLAPNDPTIYLIPEAPAITLVKTGVLSADGNTITYTFSIRNTGNVTLNHFQFSDAKLSSPVSFTPATIAPGEIATATAGYIISQTEKNAGTVRNTAIITATAPSGTIVTDVSGTAENNDYPTIIEISKLTSSKAVTDANNNGIAEAGEALTYTILVRNNGSTTRTGVTVSDPIPTNTTYLTGSASDGATLVGNTLNWNNLTIPANGQMAVRFKVQVNAVLSSGNLAIENIATVTDPGNAIAVLKPAVSIPTEGKLEGSKSVADTKGNNDGKAQANEILTYSLTVRNTGGSPLNGVVITDELPAGLTYVAGSVSGNGTVSNNTLKWTVNMQANSSTVLYFDAKVAPDVNSYNILKNVALMISPTGAVVQPEAIIDVDQSADLVITKELITTGEIMTGSDVTYKITVTNKGANRATGVSVTDKLPTIIDAPKDITVSTGTTSYSSVTRDLVWMVGSLDLNQTATITFKSRTLAAGPLSNSATVKGDQPDPSMGNNYVLADGATIKGDELLIPNLFTPNGDGRNDTFEIRGLTEFAENEITIVNRWGNQVYHAKNYQNNWSGEGLNEATYFYLVKVRKSGSFEWKVFNGYITLIRAFKN